MNVFEVCCVGKGTSSCEGIVIGKMAKMGEFVTISQRHGGASGWKYQW